MEVHIKSPQPTVLNGEAIELELTLRNTGEEALTLPALDDPASPQPFIVIQGPSFLKPHRFHWSGRTPAAGEASGEPTRIGPQQSIKAVLKLPFSLALSKPGRHEIHATYESRGGVAESNHINIKVESLGPPVFRVVGRTPLLSEIGIQALSVQGQTLYLATFHEDRPDLGEVDFSGFARIATVEPGATEFFAPTCQTASPGMVGPRFGWRTGNAITVVGYHKLPQRLDLGFAPRIHAPSLMAANGDIDVLVSNSGGSRLTLLRFPHVDYDQPPPPARTVWTRELPEPLIDLVAGLNPAGVRRALLRHASSARLMSWDDAGPEFDAPLALNGRPVPEVLPALHISVSGIVRATALSADPERRRRVTLTQVTWQPGAAPQVAVEAPIDLQSAIRSGTIAYSMRSVESPRRDWVFVLESHRVQHSQSEGKAYVTKRQLPLPPQVLVMQDVSYDLEVHSLPELNMLQ